MFEAPPRLTAAVFSQLNWAEHNPTGESEWLVIQRPGAPATSFIEGPAFDAQGHLWICDIPWGRIFRISPEAHIELICQYDGEPNGLAFLPDGRLIIADHKHGLVIMTLTDKKPQLFLTRPCGERFKGVNDLICASNGDVYFTDQGQSGLHDPSGRLFRLTQAGYLECLLQGIPSPNGLVLDKEEKTLYLAVTRDNAVWRVPLLANGTVTKVGVFIRLSGGSGPDGLAIDQQGNLAVCHLGLGAVWLFDPRGEPVRRIESPKGLLTTNAAFSSSSDKLFITESESGSILCARLY